MCEAGFVEEMVAALAPAKAVVMAAGVLLEWRNPTLIDTAGTALDPTLLPFDYIGFGRGYVLRKWSCASVSGAPRILARDLPLVVGQAVLDRNVGGLRGRVDGFRAARSVERLPYPATIVASRTTDCVAATLARRLRRRARLRRASVAR